MKIESEVRLFELSLWKIGFRIYRNSNLPEQTKDEKPESPLYPCNATLKISRQNGPDPLSQQLLKDIRAVLAERLSKPTLFSSKRVEKIPSRWLRDRLIELPDRPWSRIKNGRPLSFMRLARMLRPFGLFPVDLREGSKVFKAYVLEELARAVESPDISKI